MDILLNDFGDFSLCLVSKENIPRISSFIIRVNREYHLQSNTLNYEELQNTIEVDKASHPNSYFYAIKNRRNELIGSIKAEKWNYTSKLPIEEDFNINIRDILNQLPYIPTEIWHIGRFAIDQQKLKADPKLRKYRLTFLKLLLANAFQHINQNSKNIALAECDRKLFEKLKLLQIHSRALGESKMYLGSETLPIINTAQGVKKFVNSNKNLCFLVDNRDMYSA